MTALWDIAPCIVVLKYTDVSEVRTEFIALIMDAVRTSETSVYFDDTTRRYIPESRIFIGVAVRT
jgi:hypothetical protein